MNFWIQLRYWIIGFIPFRCKRIVCRPWIRYLDRAQICGQRILYVLPTHGKRPNLIHILNLWDTRPLNFVSIFMWRLFIINVIWNSYNHKFYSLPFVLFFFYSCCSVQQTKRCWSDTDIENIFLVCFLLITESYMEMMYGMENWTIS